jgi:peroxiredoxin
MTISVGDRLPDVQLHTMTAEGPKPVSSLDALGTGKVVLFAVPGAFTPGCSNVHLPGFVENGAELRAKGVDTIACVAVNDAFVMDAWGKAHGVGSGGADILMLADGNGTFTEAIGMVLDGSGFGLGQRSKRYAAVLQDGVITSLDVDGVAVEASACSNLLLKL